MRILVLATFIFAAVMFPELSRAQVYRHETPPPVVTAAGESWQLNREAIFHAGAFYLPSGPDVFFDGKVMMRTGVYEGVPLYEDATLEPYAVIYVPVGTAVMRPYARLRDDDFAGVLGTVGLDVPRAARFAHEWRTRDGYVRVPRSALGRRGGSLRDDARAAPTPGDSTFAPASLETIGAAQSEGVAAGTPAAQGMWLEFDGARWYSAGRAVAYDATRFEPAGDYRGFTVYRERGGAGTRLFVTVVHDGPVAPFDRH